MNSLYFKFKNCKAPSTNASKAVNWRTKRQFKTKKYSDFEQRVQIILLSRRSEIQAFESTFDIYSQHISYKGIFYIPESKLFTKKKYISHSSGDFDNYLKCATDSIFKHFNKLTDTYIKHVEEIEYLVSENNEYHFDVRYTKRDNKLLYPVLHSTNSII